MPKVRVYRKSETASPIDERNLLFLSGVFFKFTVFSNEVVYWFDSRMDETYTVYSRYPMEGDGGI
jgi:hypothetical protein